jgi:hypothetical protein
MVPAQLVPGAVAMPADGLTQPFDLADQRIAVQQFQIVVHRMPSVMD